MKVFIIHSGKDVEEVNKIKEEFYQKCHSLEMLSLDDKQTKYWKKDAYKKIKEADCALFIVGENSYLSENIDWEIKKFIKLKKQIYTYKLSSNVKYNEVLFKANMFGNGELIDKTKYMFSKELEKDKLFQIFNNQYETDIIDELGINSKQGDPSVILEQYKIYLQTSEDLVTRRQNVSNFYTTINSLLLTVCGVVTPLMSNMNILYLAGVICIFSIIGSILCFNWMKVISSYGQLNSAKMKVISVIEKTLPLNIYDTEWKVQTDKMQNKKYCSFTSIEKRVPKVFIAIYIILIVIMVAIAIITRFL